MSSDGGYTWYLSSYSLLLRFRPLVDLQVTDRRKDMCTQAWRQRRKCPIQHWRGRTWRMGPHSGHFEGPTLTFLNPGDFFMHQFEPFVCQFRVEMFCSGVTFMLLLVGCKCKCFKYCGGPTQFIHTQTHTPTLGSRTSCIHWYFITHQVELVSKVLPIFTFSRYTAALVTFKATQTPLSF